MCIAFGFTHKKPPTDHSVSSSHSWFYRCYDGYTSAHPATDPAKVSLCCASHLPPTPPLPQQNNSARYQNGSQKYPQLPKIKPDQAVRVDVDMDAGTAVFTVDGEKVPNNPVFDNLAGQTVWPCVLMYTPNRQVTIVKVGKVGGGGGGGGGMTSVRSSWRKLVVVSFCFGVCHNV